MKKIEIEFVESISTLNSMIRSVDFLISVDNIISIQYNPAIRMYCVYYWTYEEGEGK